MLELNKLPKDKGDRAKKATDRAIMRKIFRDKFPTDETGVYETIKSVASQTGLDPAFLAANSYEEGMSNILIHKQKGTWEGLGDEEYPVSGYAFYGLDTFGEKYKNLMKKGYIPSDFENRFLKDPKVNEKGQEVMSAEFKTNRDALIAKSAMIRDIGDSVDEYAKKNGIKLEPRAKNYFIMSAYNGGFGNAKIMMDEMKKSNVSQSEFIDKGLTTRKGVHKNISRRMETIDVINDMISKNELSDTPVIKETPKVPEFVRFNEILKMVGKAYGKK